MASTTFDEVDKMTAATRGEFEMLFHFITKGQMDEVIDLVQKKDFSEEVFINLSTASKYVSMYVSPLKKAICHGHLDIVKFLLSRGLDYQARCESNPMIEACREGRMEIVKVLIEDYGYDINTRNSNIGDSAMIVAADSGHWHVCKYLMDIGADVNYVGFTGTVLHACARMGNINMCKTILSRGFNDINVSDRRGFSALHIAVCLHVTSAVKFLVENGANVNQASNIGETPLFFAVQFNNSEAIKVLHTSGAIIGAIAEDLLDQLKYVIDTGKLVPAHFLLVTLNISQKGTESLISIALDDEYDTPMLSMIVLLLQVGCPVKGKDYNHLAKYLEKVPRGQSSRYINNVLYNPRSLADMCCFSIRRRLGRNLPQVVDKLQLSKKSVDFLNLAHVTPDEKRLGGDLKSNDGQDDELLISDQDGKYCKISKPFTDDDVMASTTFDESHKMTRASDDEFEMVLDMIAMGQKDEVIDLVQKKDFSEKVFLYLSEFSSYASPLNKAIYHGHLDIVKLLHARGLDYWDRYESHPLIEASKRGRIEIVKLLVQGCGYDMNTCDSNTDTALMVAAASGQWDVCKYLVDIGADVNHVGSGGTVLHACVNMQNLDMCKFILSSGFNNINASDNGGYSALHTAVSHDVTSVVKLLSENGANVNQASDKRDSPLWYAINCDTSFETIKVLHAPGAIIDIDSLGGIQKLESVISMGKLVSVHFFLVTLNMSQEGTKSLISIALDDEYDMVMVSMIVLLLHVGCPVKGKDYDQLSEYLEKVPSGPASRYINNVLYNPRSLADTCCFSIRRRLGRNLPQVVDKLQLPKKLVDFLNLAHVTPDYPYKNLSPH